MAGKKKPGKAEHNPIKDDKGISAFAKQVKKLREEKNMTQEALAHGADITLSQVARIETCKNNPTISSAFALARSLGVTLAELFDFPVPPAPPRKKRKSSN